MIDKVEKSTCTGCNACLNICPKLAITMLADIEGFQYPVVDKRLCDNCGLCLRICPTLNKFFKQINFLNPDIFAAWSLNEEVRINSTSGGIFSELAKKILENGGYVVGAKYNDKFTVEHHIINNVQELPKLRQSKYLQSNVGFIYKKIRKLLIDKKEVLFCGTPCQNAGLTSYLQEQYDNLLLCDFICRGVNSPTVYLKYLSMLQERYRSKIIKVIFKNKTYGWNQCSTLIKFENGDSYIEDRNHDLFMIGYLRYNLYVRPSCYNCMFKKLPRISDISLGDFWGIGKTRPHLDQNKGTSVLFINSDKGKSFFERIQPNIYYEKCTFEEAVRGNVCILNSIIRDPRRDNFFIDLRTNSFDKVMEKYLLTTQRIG